MKTKTTDKPPKDKVINAKCLVTEKAKTCVKFEESKDGAAIIPIKPVTSTPAQPPAQPKPSDTATKKVAPSPTEKPPSADDKKTLESVKADVEKLTKKSSKTFTALKY